MNLKETLRNLFPGESIMKRSFMLLALFIFFSMLMYIPPTNQFLRMVNIFSGVIVLLLIPGLCVTQLIFGLEITFNLFGFSLIFGLLVQLLNVLSLYSIGSLFFYESIDFKLVIILMSFAFVSLANLFLFLKRNRQERVTEANLSLSIKTWLSGEALILYILFAAALIIHLYFQKFTVFPTTDASHDMGMAQNLLKTGQFTSKFINPLYESRYALGFNSHPFAYFLMCIFYLIGGVSYGSIQLMVSVVGALLIFPAYGITNLLSNRKTAILAAVIITIDPLLILFSSAAWGPEILSSLFIITAVYFILLWLKRFHLRFAVFTGLFAFLALQSWYTNFYVLMLFMLPPMLLLFNRGFSKNNSLNLKELFIAYLSLAVFFAVFQFSVRVNVLVFVIPLFVLLHGYIILKKRNNSFLLGISILCVTILVLEALYLVRTYYYPAAIIVPTLQNPATTSLIPQLSVSVTEQFSEYWLTVSDLFSPLIFCLGLLSLANGRQLKEKFSLLMFPLFQSIGFALFIGGALDRRFLVSAIPFIIILSASAFEILLSMKRLVSKSTVLTVFLISIIFAIQFVPQYTENISYFHNYWDSRFSYYDPLGNQSIVNWIDSNVPKDAVLMVRGVEWAWMTDRSAVVPQPFELNETVLFQEIVKFNVSFVIVDHEFRSSYPNLAGFLNGNDQPIANVVYKIAESTDSAIYIYDTRKVLAYGKTLSMVNLPDLEDTQLYELRPHDTYGNWTYMHVGVSDGYKVWSLLKFNLSQLAQNTTIHVATLSLHVNNTEHQSLGSFDIILSLAKNSDWSEDSATWDNKPDDMNYTGFQLSVNIRGWVSFDLTEPIKQFNGQVISVYIQPKFLLANGTNSITFSSRESSSGNSPYLGVIYSSGER